MKRRRAISNPSGKPPRRNRWYRRLGMIALPVLITVLSFTAGDSTRAEVSSAPGKKTVRLLAIGNSFTNNAVRFLPEIVSASPNTELILGKATVGGGPLEQHWRAVEAHEADADDPKGRIYRGESLRMKLREQPWDFITIQQNSFKSTDLATYRPFAKNLADYIRKHAPDAEIVIHQTWAYRKDDERFDGDYTQEAMYRDLTNAYLTIAKELSVEKIIPVGRAFQEARNSPRWTFAYPDPDFDYENATFPQLPRQTHSLNRGWHWSRDKKLRNDGHHANAAGEYLAASVWYEFFFPADVRGNSFLPEELNQEDVVFLQEVAHKIVAGKTELILNGHP